MACEYAIEAYGPDADRLPGIVDEAFDEVDRIDHLMSHYNANSPLSRVNREAAQHPVAVEPELFDFIVDAMRYHRDSSGAFDITVGPLMKAWGFFRGEGRVPSEDELAAARHHVGGGHVLLDPISKTIGFDEPGVELDLGGIAKGYAVDRAVDVFRRRRIAAALVSAGGSTIYGLGAPPGRPVVLVSQELDHLIRPLAQELKVEHLLTNRLEFRDGRATGRLLNPVVGSLGGAASLSPEERGETPGWESIRSQLPAKWRSVSPNVAIFPGAREHSVPKHAVVDFGSQPRRVERLADGEHERDHDRLVR